MRLALAACAVAAALVLVEWRRAGRHRASRLVAASVAVLALLGLSLGVTREAPSGPAAITLLTPGARGPSLGAAYAIGVTAPGATTIPDLAWLLRHRPDVGRITVRGWGLDEDEWSGAGGPLPVSVEPKLAAAPAGITAIAWPGTITLGEELVVRGRARAACDRCALVLSHAGVPLDSAMIGERDTAFTLRARPRAAGRWRPVLAFSPREAAAAETLAVDVRIPVPPRVLVVDASPSFESRFLKDWLGRQGATVAVRTRLARARTGVAALNATPDAAIDSTALTRWDVVVLRASSLAALAPDERRAIAAAVRDGGLGLLLVVDSAVAPGLLPDVLSRVDAQWLVAPSRGAEVRRARLVWDAVTTAPVAVATGVSSPPEGPGILARDEAHRPLAAAVPVGRGQLAVSLVPEPARWMLAGDSASYAAWWSRLLGAVHVEGRDRITWSAAGGPWFVDHPVTVHARATTAPNRAVLEAADFGADTLALASDAVDGTRALARFRPHAQGWQVVGGADGLALFAYDTSRWRPLQAQRRIEATLAHAGEVTDGETAHGRQLPLRWPFFLLFVGATGWLWLSTASGVTATRPGGPGST